MKSAKALASFCADLSSDKPSPGGGTASAAAGAMAASLLVMVCGITLKSKKHERDWSELELLKEKLASDRDELVQLADEDAKAYDLVVEAAKNKRQDSAGPAAREYAASLLNAAEVPMKTAFVCLRVIETAVRVAKIGKKSASSDVGVAIRLAEAGFRGAAMNVRINLSEMSRTKYADSLSERLEEGSVKMEKAVKAALHALND